MLVTSRDSFFVGFILFSSEKKSGLFGAASCPSAISRYVRSNTALTGRLECTLVASWVMELSSEQQVSIRIDTYIQVIYNAHNVKQNG